MQISPTIDHIIRNQNNQKSKPEVYVMIGGKKAWIPDPNTFAAMGFSWSSVRVIERIVTFGDSIVWGQGLNQDQKFSSFPDEGSIREL